MLHRGSSEARGSRRGGSALEGRERGRLAALQAPVGWSVQGLCEAYTYATCRQVIIMGDILIVVLVPYRAGHTVCGVCATFWLLEDKAARGPLVLPKYLLTYSLTCLLTLLTD